MIPLTRLFPDRPEVIEQFLVKMDRLSVILDDAFYANLQVRCWFFNVFPANLAEKGSFR